jgi:hypothetical protein
MNRICSLNIHDPAAGLRSVGKLTASEAVALMDQHIDKGLHLRVDGKLSAEEIALFDRWQARTGKQLAPWYP